jgi:hypothetical protein
LSLTQAIRWLIHRIIELEWLSDELISLAKCGWIKWQRKSKGKYLQDVNSFLKRLLLLVHETSRQPARRIEFLNLRHTNKSNSHHHSIFMEKDLLGIVALHHINHNVTGTWKMIHRYLPKEVCKLLIYYIWLVLPF